MAGRLSLLGAGKQAVGITQDWTGTGTWWLSGSINASNCVAAYEAKNAPSYTSSLYNLASFGNYHAGAGSSPEWDSTNGWKFTNSTWLRTGINPKDNGDHSVIIKYSNWAGGTGYYCLFGVWNGTENPNRFGCSVGWGGDRLCFRNNVEISTFASGITAGILGIAGATTFRDGTAGASITGYDNGNYGDLDIHINGWNIIGDNDQREPGIYVQAFAYYNTTLSNAQMAALTTAMSSL